jgi:hypothetical protein
MNEIIKEIGDTLERLRNTPMSSHKNDHERGLQDGFRDGQDYALKMVLKQLLYLQAMKDVEE